MASEQEAAAVAAAREAAERAERAAQRAQEAAQTADQTGIENSRGVDLSAQQGIGNGSTD